MPQAEIHGSDIGTIFVATIKDSDDAVIDISGAVVKEFFFLQPTDTVLTKATAFTTDGTDGKIQYTTVAGDIDEAGRWKWQAHVSDATTDHKTNIKEFDVYGNIA